MYKIYVGSYSNFENAVNLCADLENFGFEPKIKKDGDVYRVLIAEFHTYEMFIISKNMLDEVGMEYFVIKE